MTRFPYTLLLVISLSASAVFGQHSRKGSHVLVGPYEYDESGKRFPEYYLFDNKRVSSIDELKFAVSQLPPGTLVYYDGTCTAPEYIELPHRPYMTFSAFERFCKSHGVKFDWYIGR